MNPNNEPLSIELTLTDISVIESSLLSIRAEFAHMSLNKDVCEGERDEFKRAAHKVDKTLKKIEIVLYGKAL